MGYILPIQHHDYADYQKRMVTKKRSIQPIKKTYKTTLQLTYEELKHEAKIRGQNNNLLPNNEANISDGVYTEEAYMEFKGKGKFINEHV